jgi:hypothetical protein
MTAQEKKQLVEQAIGSEWTSFAERHPLLARALDRDLLTEHVADRIEDDPDFQRALANARAVSAGFEGLQSTVKRLVRGILAAI